MAGNVFVQRERLEKAYLVFVDPAGDIDGRHTRRFIWGHFDEGDISPHRARKDARAYADELSDKIDATVHDQTL